MPPDPDSPRPKFNISADGTPRRFRDTSGSHPSLPRSLWGLVEVPGSPEPLPCGRLPPQLFVCKYVYFNLLSLFRCSLALKPIIIVIYLTDSLRVQGTSFCIRQFIDIKQ